MLPKSRDVIPSPPRLCSSNWSLESGALARPSLVFFEVFPREASGSFRDDGNANAAAIMFPRTRIEQRMDLMG